MRQAKDLRSRYSQAYIVLLPPESMAKPPTGSTMPEQQRAAHWVSGTSHNVPLGRQACPPPEPPVDTVVLQLLVAT